MLLSTADLLTVYPAAAGMPAGEVSTYLSRANAYAIGVIGGVPPLVDETIKAAVSLAFEIFAEGKTGQTDQVNGNITDAAPTGRFSQADRNSNPLSTVDIMLRAAKEAYARSLETPEEVGGVFWLGRL